MPTPDRESPFSFNPNDADNPTRRAEFEAALKVSGAVRTTVLQQLIEAYTRFVQTNGRAPSTPFNLVEAPPDEVIARLRASSAPSGQRKPKRGS